VKLEPFKLSLKERVSMFDKLITMPGKVSSSAATTPYPTSGGMHGMKSFPMNHSSSGVISSSTPLPLDAYPQSNNMNQESSTTLYGNQGPYTMNPNSHGPVLEGVDNRLLPYCMTGVVEEGLDQSLSQRRRGSTSDLELSSTPKYSPVPAKRNSKSRSMFVSDDGSEDGEVSSGGQEVSEIISRSYENSPM